MEFYLPESMKYSLLLTVSCRLAYISSYGDRECFFCYLNFFFEIDYIEPNKRHIFCNVEVKAKKFNKTKNHDVRIMFNPLIKQKNH